MACQRRHAKRRRTQRTPSRRSGSTCKRRAHVTRMGSPRRGFIGRKTSVRMALWASGACAPLGWREWLLWPESPGGEKRPGPRACRVGGRPGRGALWGHVPPWRGERPCRGPRGARFLGGRGLDCGAVPFPPTGRGHGALRRHPSPPPPPTLRVPLGLRPVVSIFGASEGSSTRWAKIDLTYLV